MRCVVSKAPQRVLLFEPSANIPVCESSLLQHLLGERPLHIHDELQHLIVGLAREQNLACEQLIHHTPHAPNVQGVVCKKQSDLHTQGSTTKGTQLVVVRRVPTKLFCHLAQL